MLNINNYSRSALEQDRLYYKDLVSCLKPSELETLGTILYRHRDDEIYSHENTRSMHLGDEPVIFLDEKSYALNKAQRLLLIDMKRESNGKKLGIWSRIDVLNEVYCLLKEKQPGYKNPQIAEWLGRRQGYFTRAKPKVKSGADMSESDE